MKLDKDLLKSIVKECLVEILAEGIVSNGSSTRKKKQALTEAFSSTERSRSIDGAGTANGLRQPERNRRASYLDNISYGDREVRNERQAAQAVEQEKQDILTAAEAAGNAAPLMKAMS